MALPINIKGLLNMRKIEGNRIEFKKGWDVTEVERRASLIGMPRCSNLTGSNPTDIYHSICAFANDFDNLGGGYILVGVEQHDNGLAKRPVVGINIEEVDGILKQMVGFNNMFLIHIPVHAGCCNKPATEKTTEKNAVGSEKNQAIIAAIKMNPRVTAAEIAMKLGVSSRAVEKRIKTLRESGAIRRVGGDKGGKWEVIEHNPEQ